MMKRLTKQSAAIAALAFAGANALAQEDWEITMTVDNQFDMYFGTPSATDTLAGSGSNWATTYTFNAFGRAPTDYLYVATASDYSSAQGFIGDFENLTTGQTTSTGDAVWEVFPAGAHLASMGFTVTSWPANVMPSQTEVDTAIAYATTHALWLTPDTMTGYNNGSSPSPWGARSGISGGADWIWQDSTGGGSPLIGGYNHDEFLVFRVVGAAPTPGTIALLGLGGLVAARRQRSA